MNSQLLGYVRPLKVIFYAFKLQKGETQRIACERGKQHKRKTVKKKLEDWVWNPALVAAVASCGLVGQLCDRRKASLSPEGLSTGPGSRPDNPSGYFYRPQGCNHGLATLSPQTAML